jgi:hypothetical protein
VINRRQAVIGYVTYRVARRVARREIGRRLSGLRPGVRRQAEGVQMFKNTKGTASAAAERATALVETVRPIVTKAMNDPELHEALRQAFATGREVTGEISGKPPTKAAKKLAHDRKLQRRVETSAVDLQRAVTGLVEAPRRKGRVKRVIGRIAIIGAVAGAVVVALRKFRGGNGTDDQPGATL